MLTIKFWKKCWPNRIKEVIGSLVDFDHRGFMENRRISANIRMIIDTMNHANEEDLDSLLVLIDFEKCFDKIEFQAIFGALEYFGFGDNFVSMVKTMYTDFSACIQNFGNFSEYFSVTRSVHQGGPNSSFSIFTMCRTTGN